MSQMFSPKILPMPTLEATEQIAKAAKWDMVVKFIEREGAGVVVGQNRTIAYLEELALQAKCYAGVRRICQEFNKPDEDTVHDFIRRVFTTTKKNGEAFDGLLRVCKAHGMTEGQPVANFVNELAENLRSANSEREDIVAQCERIGYNPACDDETLTEFVEQTANDVVEFGFNDGSSDRAAVDVGDVQFINCAFNLGTIER